MPNDVCCHRLGARWPIRKPPIAGAVLWRPRSTQRQPCWHGNRQRVCCRSIRAGPGGFIFDYVGKQKGSESNRSTELQQQPEGLSAAEKSQDVVSDLIGWTANWKIGEQSGSTPASGSKTSWWKDMWGRIRYSYYNWRKDTMSDLQLFTVLNAVLVLCGALLKRVVVDASIEDDMNAEPWDDLYEVLVLTIGQEFPESGAANAMQKVFAASTAVVGVAAFALVLALTEQVFMEVLEKNVKEGSHVYETGHIVILAWCHSPKDIEVLWKMLTQLCCAYRGAGGTTIVILCQRDKLEIERVFMEALPESRRYGSKFVFRKGNPLSPDDLRLVAAPAAGATIIVSDQSRPPSEADAQALRTAVLLDELDFPGYGVPDPRTGHIVVEVKSSSTVPLLEYACSKRIIPVPTGGMNAIRLSRMVLRPIVSVTSANVWSFESHSQLYQHNFPQFVGRSFGSVAFYFPNAVVLGFVQVGSGRAVLNPSPDYILEAGDELTFIRPVNMNGADFMPQEQPARANLHGWKPPRWKPAEEAVASVLPHNSMSDSLTPSSCGCAQPAPAGALGSLVGSGSWEDLDMMSTMSSSDMDEDVDLSQQLKQQCEGLYVMPMEYTGGLDEEEPIRLLIAGWGEPTFMLNLIQELDHGQAHLAEGSTVVLFNAHSPPETVGMVQSSTRLRNVRLEHIYGDPMNREEMSRKLEIVSFECCIVLCDHFWLDPDRDLSNGIELHERDMLRLESMVMVVQLNIRKLLNQAQHPDINIICEKVAYMGTTRFEDRYKLPVGMSVSPTFFSAKTLTQVAYNPRAWLPYVQLGRTVEVEVVDSSYLVEQGEMVSYWQLVARCQKIDRVLMGYFELPNNLDRPMDMLFNPQGAEARLVKHAWNQGDARVKLLTLYSKPLDERMPLDAPRETVLDEVLGSAMRPGNALRGSPGASSGAATPAVVSFRKTEVGMKDLVAQIHTAARNQAKPEPVQNQEARRGNGAGAAAAEERRSAARAALEPGAAVPLAAGGMPVAAGASVSGIGDSSPNSSAARASAGASPLVKPPVLNQPIPSSSTTGTASKPPPRQPAGSPLSVLDSDGGRSRAVAAGLPPPVTTMQAVGLGLTQDHSAAAGTETGPSFAAPPQLVPVGPLPGHSSPNLQRPPPHPAKYETVTAEPATACAATVRRKAGDGNHAPAPPGVPFTPWHPPKPAASSGSAEGGEQGTAAARQGGSTAQASAGAAAAAERAPEVELERQDSEPGLRVAGDDPAPLSQGGRSPPGGAAQEAAGSAAAGPQPSSALLPERCAEAPADGGSLGPPSSSAADAAPAASPPQAAARLAEAAGSAAEPQQSAPASAALAGGEAAADAAGAGSFIVPVDAFPGGIAGAAAAPRADAAPSSSRMGLLAAAQSAAHPSGQRRGGGGSGGGGASPEDWTMTGSHDSMDELLQVGARAGGGSPEDALTSYDGDAAASALPPQPLPAGDGERPSPPDAAGGAMARSDVAPKQMGSPEDLSIVHQSGAPPVVAWSSPPAAGAASARRRGAVAREARPRAGAAPAGAGEASAVDVVDRMVAKACAYGRADVRTNRPDDAAAGGKPDAQGSTKARDDRPNIFMQGDLGASALNKLFWTPKE